ncbi:MAG: type II toxin-antitoxin system RelE/ParE family toxin [Bacteroidetes bacterium]|nr:type II toxin-antitoxin system RelE/ParE family toxin [Bacteroidota bacterium]
MGFKIKLEKAALKDLQKAVDWYSSQKVGLGKKFYSAFQKAIGNLQKNPFYQIRYDEVRCFPLKKFPFMIHFTLQEDIELIVIRAVFHTSLDSNEWNLRG